MSLVCSYTSGTSGLETHNSLTDVISMVFLSGRENHTPDANP